MQTFHRKPTTPQFFCPICARPFFRPDRVKDHGWSHYSEQEKGEALARGEKLPKCYTYKRKFQCNKCSFSFATSLGLEKHFSDRHGEFKREKELCGLCGATVVNIKEHMKFKHATEEDKKFECGICKKKFLSNYKLVTHREVAHSDKMPFQCEICGRAFKVERYLKQHLLRHNEVKRFECVICGVRFSLGFLLKRHVESVHEGKIRKDKMKKNEYQRGKVEGVNFSKLTIIVIKLH
ncbi:putative zinc finger protein [Orchesella cincta]|uniref:Putative zinc finger protein n=1 Tax=Orchesella cincta TaxID=48709 RepID=A0A1D2M192_ORCCI|nr:putative zinc finger protein [Orchesella cincta]